MTSAVQYAIVGTGSIGAVLAQRFSDHHVPALWANTRGPEIDRRHRTVRLDHTGHPRHGPGCRRDHPGHTVPPGP